ncbi:hydroxymethylbilane synthase [Herbivorax sp. ANBcel31]|uniref:hydroxymethylbilane synthase n=1 Tax=Herbivorax sp. ANBcel31 TaxID=3069754 RepID=UPI0027AFBA3F|nr:hydroxymethylbilane synthase [Herbivorax sp. ANBcel31]MDQ2086954.1 hydroxymethylbilane synthase [Herbivorax sp. ANBcel31]
MKKIRVGSRESALAMAQTKWVIDEIKKKYTHLEFEIIGIKTKGDRILDVKLDKIGGKGLFIKEIEKALINKEIDFAVHSLKDMPAQLSDELAISVLSKREDPRDALITVSKLTLDKQKEGFVLGTSSVRREVQIKAIREDVHFKTLRGNVNTRLNKLDKEEYDAIVLAAAGLHRLGLEEKIVQYFEIDKMIPSVGQGILAIQTRKDYDIEYLLKSVHCEKAALEARAERAFLKRVNGDCSTPMAAHAVIEGDNMKLYGMLVHRGKVKRAFLEGSKYDSKKMGIELADILLESGGE